MVCNKNANHGENVGLEAGGGGRGKEEGWVLLKIPRGDINGVGEDEVSVTSGLHAQAERTNRQTEERRLHPVEISTKIRSQDMLLTHGGAEMHTIAKSECCAEPQERRSTSPQRAENLSA